MPGVRITRRRSIPACAGEPPVTAEFYLPDAVYPRVCGGTHICKLLTP